MFKSEHLLQLAWFRTASDLDLPAGWLARSIGSEPDSEGWKEGGETDLFEDFADSPAGSQVGLTRPVGDAGLKNCLVDEVDKYSEADDEQILHEYDLYENLSWDG